MRPAGAADRLPLSGRRVLVVRPVAQGAASAEILRAAGAEPVLVPLIELRPPDDGGAALEDAARRLGEYRWLICTSANGVDRLLEALGDAAPPPGLRVAAIGPATAAALAAGGMTVALVPERYVAESLLEAFPSPAVTASGEGAGGSGRILLARAAVARDVLPDGLRAMGWSVDVVAAYRAEPRTLDAGERAAAATCDTVVFTSPSVVEAFCDQPRPLPVPSTVAAIGPVTAAAARRRGLPVHVEAAEHTVAGIVAALGAGADYS